LNFCSGIGGGRLGLEQSGLVCVGYSDTSRLSVKTYKQMFNTENEQNFGNLKKIKCENLPSFDLLIAGFPCQSFSVIGRKCGFDDDRGQIIFHLIRILNEIRPKCFILENVRGLVSHDKGATIKKIMNEFDDIGYSVVYKVLTSLDYGVPQMRQRVYFVGFDKKSDLYADGFEWPTVEPIPNLENYLIDLNNNISEINLEKFDYYLKNPINQGRYVPADFLDEDKLIIDTRMSDLRLYRGKVPTLRSQRDGIFYIKDHAIKELTGFEALLLQGFPVKYADKVKDSVTNRHLLMQAGNAMTVNVIKKLGDCIINHLE
jgi:DNA (cytosine-5)-methyltransferase 1